MHWLKRLIQPRKCLECGERLRKVITSDESYVLERADMASGVRGQPMATGYIRRITYIPVYLECEKCDYRVRIRSIRARL